LRDGDATPLLQHHWEQDMTSGTLRSILLVGAAIAAVSVAACKGGGGANTAENAATESENSAMAASNEATNAESAANAASNASATATNASSNGM
jgi:hypothetical protein